MSDSELKDIKRALSKLDKLEREMKSLKMKIANLRHRDLARIAKGLGMERSRTRNTEPYFVSALLPDASPIPIPDHSGDLGVGLAGKIIKQLQSHAEDLRAMLMDKEAFITKKRNDIDHKLKYEK